MLLIRVIRLTILQLVARLYLSSFGSLRTINVGIDFIKNSSVFINIVLLIRQIKILVLNVVAPVMLTGFSNPSTSYFFCFC
ncbi:MAG: hypothetical protein ACOCRK_08025 [bacterium]